MKNELIIMNISVLVHRTIVEELIKGESYMKRIEEYYANTEVNIPHKNIKKFLEIGLNPGNAIELGCGAGRDTINLIRNKWNVLAIDREDVKDRIIKRLKQEELKYFNFKKLNFEDVILEKNNLVVANFSIPFCIKSKFNELWDKINSSILPNGYFVGNFFGIRDEWRNTKENMVFLDRQQVMALFEEFDNISFEETEKDMETGLGRVKHWHIFDVIAKKKEE